MGIETTEERIRDALRQFDDVRRGSRRWMNWQSNRDHEYAIEHDGKLYPVKAIVSLASGVSTKRFSGGIAPGAANSVAEAHGFRVVRLQPVQPSVPLTGNPDWSRDELIVALNFYLRHREKVPDKSSDAIAALSALVRRIGEKVHGKQEEPTFRNPAGTYMKLMNFRRLDPFITSQNKSGLQRGAKGDKAVWTTFADDPEGCKRAAEAIVSALTEPEAIYADGNDLDEADVVEAPEGRLLTRKHLTRERSAKLVKAKRAKVLKDKGALRCEACDFDFFERYGELGAGFIECHHVRPVSTLTDGAKTRLEDLAIVCANCHRMIHRKRPWLTIGELRTRLREANA